MKSRWFLATVLVLIGSTAAPVLAHHSLVSFNSKQPMTLRGVLTDIQWRNPHVWVLMDVKQPDGKMVNWHIEFSAPNNLNRLGFRPAMLDLKSTYIFEIWPANDGSPNATGRMLTFPDGQKFDIHDIWGDFMPQVNK